MTCLLSTAQNHTSDQCVDETVAKYRSNTMTSQIQHDVTDEADSVPRTDRKKMSMSFRIVYNVVLQADIELKYTRIALPLQA